MSTHNICFCGETRKKNLNTPLIYSTGKEGDQLPSLRSGIVSNIDLKDRDPALSSLSNTSSVNSAISLRFGRYGLYCLF